MESRFEEMGSFFDERVEGYDEHMRGMFDDFDHYYETLSSYLDKSDEGIRVLDLGCGTGAELAWIFGRAPNASITGIDMSKEMLVKLEEKFQAFRQQLHLVHGSYLTLPLGTHRYDYAVSVYTMHHFTEATKLGLYRKIRDSLKPGGKYIEGDCVVTPEKQREIQQWYEANYSQQELMNARDATGTLYHYDIPFTIETQLRLLREAGFSKVDLAWHEEGKEPAIFVAVV